MNEKAIGRRLHVRVSAWVILALAPIWFAACDESSRGAEIDMERPVENRQPIDLQNLTVDRALLEKGRAGFENGKCVMCHGPSGEGKNEYLDLTDDTWAHCDGSVKGILDVMRSGVPRESMKDTSFLLPMTPSTQVISDEATLIAIAAYVKSLQKGG